MNHKMLSAIAVAVIATVSILSVAGHGVVNSDVQANATVDNTVALDWDVQVGEQGVVKIRPGQSLNVPITFMGSTQDREVDVYITEADPRFGAGFADVNNPRFPNGISVELSVSKINMQAMPDKIELSDREIGVFGLSISVDENVKPGQYVFGIHMVDDDGKGSDGTTIDALYIEVE